jgi:hypothetical protein
MRVQDHPLRAVHHGDGFVHANSATAAKAKVIPSTCRRPSVSPNAEQPMTASALIVNDEIPSPTTPRSTVRIIKYQPGAARPYTKSLKGRLSSRFPKSAAI